MFGFLAALLMGSLLLGILFYNVSAAREALDAELRRDHLELVDSKFSWWRGGRNSTWLDFEARELASRKLVTGHYVRRGAFGGAELYYDDRYVPPRAPIGSQRPSEVDTVDAVEVDAGADLETRIRFETNQRLERLQGDREAFLANDVNGDGMVDAAEWELVRARVAAEVRAELTGEPAPAVEEALEAAEEQAAPASTDGHW